MACLDNIIAIKDPCTGVSDVTPLSGYHINDYPGITMQFAANAADERTQTGLKFLQDVRRRAMMKLNADIKAYINSEYRVNSIPFDVYKAAEFVTPSTVGTTGSAGNRRGVVVSKVKVWCRLFKMCVTRVRIYSNQTIDTTLRVTDVGTGTAYNVAVSLVAGNITTLNLNKVLEGVEVQVTLPSDISLYSAKPNCGCNADKSYLLTQGISYSGGSYTLNSNETYGIEVDMILKCDLDSVVCDMATDGLIGQAAYELCGAMAYDELLRNNRMNYLTIYKAEEIKAQAQAGFEAYRDYMDKAMMGMRQYLTRMDGGCKCVDCSGLQIKSNV
jgi:hypothetical protein